MLKHILCHYITKNINKNIFFILIFQAVLVLSCGPSERSLNFRNSQITGKVDSIIITKRFDYKKNFFLVKNKWYVVPAGFYGFFIDYVTKGDSLYKESGRWDIYVYKKRNGTYTEKYFSGAQEYWK